MKLSIITLCVLLSSAAFANKLLIRDAKGNPINTQEKIKLTKPSKDILGKKLSDIMERMDQARCEKIKEQLVEKIDKDLDSSDEALKVVDHYVISDKETALEIEDKKSRKTIILKMNVKPEQRKCDFSPRFK